MKITMADQIEIGLRQGNREKEETLRLIRAQCEFVKANSTNIPLKNFAEVILRIAGAEQT